MSTVENQLDLIEELEILRRTIVSAALELDSHKEAARLLDVNAAVDLLLGQIEQTCNEIALVRAAATRNYIERFGQS